MATPKKKKPTRNPRVRSREAATKEALELLPVLHAEWEWAPPPVPDDMPNGLRTTMERQHAFLAAYVKSGCNVSRACKAVKVYRSSYYRWLNATGDIMDTYGRNFAEQVTDAREGLYDEVEGKLLELAMAGNTKALIFYAKTKMKKRGYVERQEHDHGDGMPVTGFRIQFEKGPGPDAETDGR